MPTAHKVCPPI